MKRYLLFDSGCSLCTEVARRVEEAAGGWLEARSLRDPEMQALLDKAKPGWKWEPTLVEVDGDEVRVYQGFRMRLRMVQGLGPVRAVQVARLVAHSGGPVLGVNWGRRDFLRRSLRAASALLVWQHLRSVETVLGPSPQPVEEIEVFAGFLRAFTDDEMEIETLTGLRKIRIPAGISVWKGSEQPLSVLERGDEVMVRLHVPSGMALRLWANLTRVRGVVTRVLPGGYELQTSGLHDIPKYLRLEIGEEAWVADWFTERPLGASGLVLNEGDFVDVIGERTLEGIRGSRIWTHSTRHSDAMVSPRDSSAGITANDRVEVGPNGLCWYIYTGYAGWFDCPTGAGRCGTCNLSRSDQAAWPAMDTCGCCNSTCCDCSRGCKNQIYLPCGKSVVVYDKCSTRGKAVYIADCGPCQRANCIPDCVPGHPDVDLCSRSCADCWGGRTAIIDLTKPTFAYFYDPARRGCFSCEVRVQAQCP